MEMQPMLEILARELSSNIDYNKSKVKSKLKKGLIDLIRSNNSLNKEDKIFKEVR